MKRSEIQEIREQNKFALRFIERRYGDVLWTITNDGCFQYNYRNSNGELKPLQNKIWTPIECTGTIKPVEPIAEDEQFYYFMGYFISNYARCYSTRNYRFITPTTTGVIKKGYEKYILTQNYIRKHYKVSNLIGGIFDRGVLNRYGCLVDLEDTEQYNVHHIDLDSKNNKADNLIILTDSDHMKVHKMIKQGMDLSSSYLIDKFLKQERECNK